LVELGDVMIGQRADVRILMIQITLFESQGMAIQDLAVGPCVAMAFLPGGDLVSQTKPAGLLPLTTVLSIIARVADALDYAHAQHVVHRDIKPANIMYEPLTDQVKVTDFGIARITDSSRTKAGMVLGTPAYMSPEQITGKKIDGRSDLYSLGVMLYQMCCGQPPFAGDSLARLMFKITSEAPTDILSINPALPAELIAVINKSLSKTVEGRYQRGATMAAALRACQEKLPTVVAGLPQTEKVTT
jgi:serine/threonine protein kinase